jgi:dolichol-phosphate mannosyltransferase
MSSIIADDHMYKSFSKLVDNELKLSLIVPCFNEESVIETFYKRAINVLCQISYSYEIIFVNDGSRDRTLNILMEMSNVDPHVKLIDLSRNFGHQIAVSAGIEHSTGDLVILIDADLQDPPELIPQLIEKWRDGYDVVYAVRKNRQGESWFKKWTANKFYRTINRLSDVDIPLDTGDFRLMTKDVVNQLVTMKERHRFIRGMVAWVGYKQIGIEYDRDMRFSGETKYTIKKMQKFAYDGITSFSTKPLAFATGFGFFIAIIGFLAMAFIIVMKFMFKNNAIQGWSSQVVILLFVSAIQLIILGIIGEYIGRIYDEVRNRPLYIVKNKYNFHEQSDLMNSNSKKFNE